MRMRKILAVFTALSMLAAAPGASAAPDAREDENLLAFIEALCTVNEIDPALVQAVIETESSWNARAVNPAGNCLGLMQISLVNRAWLRGELGVEDLFDPYQNVMAGIEMLSRYLRRFGDSEMALMCYNCGEAGAQARFAQGEYSTAYSRLVLARAERIRTAGR